MLAEEKGALVLKNNFFKSQIPRVIIYLGNNDSAQGKYGIKQVIYMCVLWL